MSDDKTHLLVPVQDKPFARSPVDIIIPFHGQYDKVAALVKSILLATRSNPYQICLVDDASPNVDFIKELKEAPQVTTVRNDTQRGFGASLNRGLRATQQPWVVFLNSDCHIEESNWLIEMGRALLDLKPHKVRMVSARSDNPGFGCDLLQAKPGTASDHHVLTDSEFLPLYCAMCHRDLFRHIGGMVKEYPLGGYEDEELAFRMRRQGFRQAVCGRSWVHHDGGATLEAICRANPKAKTILERNRDLCLADIRKIRA